MSLSMADIVRNPGTPTAREAWAQSLDITVLRSLAKDYTDGDVDPAAEDAYNELKRRKAAGLLSSSKRCAEHRDVRKGGRQTCPACQAMIDELEAKRKAALDAIFLAG